MPVGPDAPVLVTGASGVLGGYLLKHLQPKAAVGVSRTGGKSTMAVDLGAAENVASLFKKHRFSLVIHSAAYSDVDGCERDASRAWSANAESTKHLAEACRREKIPLIYISTDYVFDGRKRTPYTESDSVCPINIYGLSKLAGEHYARRAGVSAAVRTSWLFGGGNAQNFVNAVLPRLKSMPAVEVLDDQTDAPTYAKDLAEALLCLMDPLLSQHEGFHETFQICNDGEATRHSMTLEMKKILGLAVSVGVTDKNKIQNRLAIRPVYGVMSPHRFEKFVGVKMRAWQSALSEYLKEDDTCVY
jgi:dTDP-4-dehydrorhamnose reductase